MGNRRRRTRRIGAVAAIERQDMQRMLHGVVRSTATAAPAAMSALVRTRLHGAVREPVDGEAGTGDARSAEGTSQGEARNRRSRPGRAPRRAGRVAQSRGECGGAGDDAIGCVVDRAGPTAAASAASRRASVSAQRPEGAEARGIAAVIGGRASARRFERRARSRSDAPKPTVAFGTPANIVCTSGIASASIGGTGSIGVGTIGGRWVLRSRNRDSVIRYGGRAERVAAGDVRREGEPCERRATASRSPSDARSAREDGRRRDLDVRTRKRAVPPPERRHGPRCAAATRCIGRPGCRAGGRGPPGSP